MKQSKPHVRPAATATERLTRIGMLASWVSLGSFFFYLRRGEILMLGDTVAHINIARRVFDSLYPGLLQLGTVWLPLPHLLMMPFLVPDKLWQSGIGGSIPSMVAYVFGVLGIVRLVTALLADYPQTQKSAQTAGYVAALVFGANPNLIYAQSTAITEPLYLAFFIWAMVYFAEFANESKEDLPSDLIIRQSLRRCAIFVACAELTRYDGWFMAGLMGALVLVIAAGVWKHRFLRWQCLKFVLAISIAPLLWLAYNKAIYGNAFEFANGEYSARAIEARVDAPNPAVHNLWVGASYFLKSAQLTLAVGNWGRFWLLAAMIAAAIVLWRLRNRSTVSILLLLWSPVVFYALSIAYGSVPLHVPIWWPFAIFNQRFGLELLPLFGVSAGVLIAAVPAAKLLGADFKPLAAALLILVSYGFVWAAKPLCWHEASRNWEMRRGLDTAVERTLKEFPPDARYLMDLSTHVGIMERLGIPLHRVVNNEDHRAWKRPSDPEGLWERALADPGKYVNYVIVFEGDVVDKELNRSNLTLLEVIHSFGQPTARIYQTSLR